MHPTQLLSLGPVDIIVIAAYFVMVLGIGFYLKRYTTTGEDFFLAGRDMTAWIAGLSFVSANLGALELMGWAGAAYQYGILATHWYWIGAIPAMLFLGLVMMPFYYISKTHSVPGYLKLRFGEAARATAAISFALMTVLMSRRQHVRHGRRHAGHPRLGHSFSIWISSLTVGVYVVLGGLLSAIFNEVLQFVLIWLGAIADFDHRPHRNRRLGRHGGPHPPRTSGEYTHLWSTLGHFSDNPMGIHWTGIVLGLGFVISFGYWTTDFLVVQRILSAKDLRSAKMAPIIGAGFKMLVPFIVIRARPARPRPSCPSNSSAPMKPPLTPPCHTYNEVLPLMLARYCGPGLLGLGITALVAGFMSGMAGNVTAFSTVWTYDIYRALIKKDASDQHYVSMGRWSTILGVLVSIGTAYFVMNAKGIMDYVQALFSFFIAPLFGTVVLGMLWKRATPAGGFWGLLTGTVASIAMWEMVRIDPSTRQIIALSVHAQAMAEDMYRALWSWIICVAVTVVVSYATKPLPDSQLVGLVYGCTPIPSEGDLKLYQRPIFWAVVVAVVLVILNIVVW